VIALIVSLQILALYLTGWAYSSRILYCAWRPSRAPLCGKKSHMRYGGVTGHESKCYRRTRRDLTTVPIDNDADAVAWAMFASVAWPVLLVAHALRHDPPDLPEEKAKALADAEREAGIG
jgi:hypothetical protein